MTTVTQARNWLERWDRQQERYIADREERFTVIADVVETSLPDRADTVSAPRILDLGAGPGSLSARLLDRFPDATVVAVDADPLLLGLARLAYGDRSGLHIEERDLRGPDWSEGLGTFDAVVSTTALHWLTGAELRAVYAEVATLTRPGGVFVDGDNMSEPVGLERLEALARHVQVQRERRVGVEDNEDWAQWWDAVAASPELADLASERGARPIDHSVPDVPTVADHAAFLRDAGFTEVGTVWQHGTDRVLVGVR